VRGSGAASRWLLPIALAAIGAGYVAPWVNHSTAGLVVSGLDLGEYVKFLPAIRHGQVVLWREGFYLPLLALSLGCSLYVFSPRLRYPFWLRGLLLALSIVAIGNFLPPAWTPARMLTPEFRQQAAAILVCAVALVASPLLGRAPGLVSAAAITGLAIAAAWTPVHGFLRVLDGIAELYRQPIQPAWGLFVMCAGLVGLALFGWLAARA
jgi:hypothetical protein